jgi:hypothetical protein
LFLSVFFNKFVKTIKLKLIFSNNPKNLKAMKLKSLIAIIVTVLTVNYAKAQVTTDYYKDSEVIFCEDVVDGSPVNAATIFNIGANGGYVQVQVQNYAKIKTETLIVDVWKKSSSGEYDKFIETKKFTVEPAWTAPYFKYTFYKAGKYKLAIYNEDEVFINSGYITINWKDDE